MKIIVVALALVLSGFALKGTGPNFKSPRNFYRAGDSVTVVLRDSTLELAICIANQHAVYYFQVEKQEGKSWQRVYTNEGPCPAMFPTTTTVSKGFTLGHRIRTPGVYRFRIGGQYFSNSFEVR